MGEYAFVKEFFSSVINKYSQTDEFEFCNHHLSKINAMILGNFSY